ncbi:MAG: Rrf2 family transcriptional regulator [Clostridia bacterium]|nr:Rrf2 family transcriptional regulator [Clostridia bacterium]
MISTRGRYALRVMVDLAQNDSGAFIPLKDIAARQDISKKYLEIIMKDLVSGGLLQGISGKGGGYRLCRKPEDYSLLEILSLTEGDLSPVACLADGGFSCERRDTCPTLPLWREYNGLIRDFFASKRLCDLIKNQTDS